MAKYLKRILLIGNGQFYHVGAFFKKALEKMGYEHSFIDESKYFDRVHHSILQKVMHRMLGRRPLTYWSFNHQVLQAARRFDPSLILIIKGSYVSPKILARIKAETRATLINYGTDDPFNSASSTGDIVATLPLYDIYFTTKRAIVADLYQAGTQHVHYIPFAYEPALHFPERPASSEEPWWRSDVMFAGGCDQDRAYFFKRLARLGLDMRLYGGYWDRYPELRRFWHGFALGRDYRLALGGSKIAPCLVRRSNRDGHVMRTFEIPACGAFLLAERTEEHLELFEESKEMVCFGSPEELVDKVRYYVAHDKERERVAEAGYKKVTGGKHTYQDRLIEILDKADGL